MPANVLFYSITTKRLQSRDHFFSSEKKFHFEK